MPSKQVLELDHAVNFGDDRARIRIPLRKALAAFDRIAVVHLKVSALRDLVNGTLAPVLVEDHHSHVAAHGNEPALAVARGGAVADLDLTRKVAFDERVVGNLRRAADVERAHGKLGTRLADRLRGDHADSLADIDRRAAREVAAVALAANAVFQLASQRRADANLLDLGFVERAGLGLIDEVASLDDDLTRGRMGHVVGGHAAENAVANGDKDFAGIDDGAELDALIGAAIVLGYDAVLRHVDEAPGEITGVRGLERRVGKALARAVRRVEVFENRQPLLEVGDDRRLDDLAGRLGHEAAHAGELAHLLLGTARAGVRHHVDRVDRLLAARRLIVLNGRDAVHHLLGDAVGAFRPGIDDLVVFLHLRDQAVIILLLVVENERLGVGDDLLLRLGDEHVVLAEGDAGLIGVMEAKAHDPVAEDDRFLLPARAVDGVDHARDVLLGQKPIHKVEADTRHLQADARPRIMRPGVVS